MIGMCTASPEMGFWEDVTDGEGEARMLKAVHEMRRKQGGN